MAKAKATKVVHNWDRHGYNTPYHPESMVGKVFAGFLRAEGMKVLKAKEMIKDLRETKKGGAWVLTDIRNGKFNGATWTFTEKNGVGKVTNLKMPRTLKAKPVKKAKKAKPAKKTEQAAPVAVAA